VRRALSAAALLLLVAGIPAPAAPATAAPTASALASATTVATTAPATTIAAVAPTPLVVMIDTSGSMSESVPASGGASRIVKLDAAKAALQEPIRNAPPGAHVGIWQFPAGSGECSSGSWLVRPDSGDSPGQLIQQVLHLTADGGTPTGPALTAVVDDLRAQGIAAANLLLVSDGLYNCGEDPCVVAKQLAGSGFPVSIQAVGFDIDPAGRDSLKCIADATGGNYFDASDGAELQKVIAKLTTPTFDLTISGQEHPIAGTSTRITATVTNTSSFDAHSVRLHLGFDASQGGLDPVVIPRDIGIGALPPGGTVTRSWSFVAGLPGHRSSARYSVSASSLETLPVSAEGSFTTSAPGFELSDAGPLLTDLAAHHESLAILGDSFSSGEGAHDYLPATSDVRQSCHRSRRTYLAPTLTAADVRVEVLACSGATTSDFTAGQFDTRAPAVQAPPQLLQLGHLATPPGAAVLTIGGNDIGFKDVVTWCVATPCTTVRPLWTAEHLAATQSESLSVALLDTYEKTWRQLNQPSFVAARHGRYAPVVVLSYPQIVQPWTQGTCHVGGAFRLWTAELKYANTLIDSLNATIASSVLAARKAGYEVYDVTATRDAVLPQHTVCGASGNWVNHIALHALDVDGTSVHVVDPDPESFHPNADGYQAISDAIVAWSSNLHRVSPSAGARASAASARGAPFPDTAVVDLRPASSTTVHAGDGISVDLPDAGGLPALSELHSDPRPLGSLVPDAHGRLRGVLSIPGDTPPGSHELVIHGWSKGGTPITRTFRVDVVPRTPLWITAVTIAGGIAALGAVVLVGVVGWRRRRELRDGTS
jgi:lysophospholipase L1-like esterase